MQHQETVTGLELSIDTFTLSDDSLMTTATAAAASASSVSTFGDIPSPILLTPSPNPAEQFSTPPPTPTVNTVDESRTADEGQGADDIIKTIFLSKPEPTSSTEVVEHSNQNGVLKMDIDQAEVIQHQNQNQANPESATMPTPAAITEDMLQFQFHVPLPPQVSSSTTGTTSSEPFPFTIYINRNNFTVGQNFTAPAPYDNTLLLNFVCSINENGEPTLAMMDNSSSALQPQLPSAPAPPSPLPTTIPIPQPPPTPTTDDNAEEGNEMETPFPELIRIITPPKPKPVLSLVRHGAAEEETEEEIGTTNGTPSSLADASPMPSDEDNIEILSIHSPRKRTLSEASPTVAEKSKKKTKAVAAATTKKNNNLPNLPHSVVNEIIQEVSVFAQKSAVAVAEVEAVPEPEPGSATIEVEAVPEPAVSASTNATSNSIAGVHSNEEVEEAQLQWRKCFVCLSKKEFTENVFAVKKEVGGKPQILKKIEPLLSHLALPVMAVPKEGSHKDTGLCFTCMDSLQRFHIFKTAVSRRQQEEQEKAKSVVVVRNNNNTISISRPPSSLSLPLVLEPFERLMYHQNYVNMKKVKEVYNSSTHSHFVRRHLTDKDWEFFCQKLYPLSSLKNSHTKEMEGKLELERERQKALSEAKALLEKYFNSKEKLSHIFCGICNKMVEEGRWGFLQHLVTVHRQRAEELYLPCEICGILVPELNNDKKQNGTTENDNNPPQDYFSHWISHFRSNSKSSSVTPPSSQVKKNNSLNEAPPTTVIQKTRKPPIPQQRFVLAEGRPLRKVYPGSDKEEKAKWLLSKKLEKAQKNSVVQSNANELPFTCELCDKRFKSKDSLKSHQMVHTGAYPFHCSACGKGIRKKAAIAPHLRTHKKDMPSATAIPRLAAGSDSSGSGTSTVPPPATSATPTKTIVGNNGPVTTVTGTAAPSNTSTTTTSSSSTAPTTRPTLTVIPSPSTTAKNKKLIQIYAPPVPVSSATALAKRSFSEAAYLSMPNLSRNERGRQYQREIRGGGLIKLLRSSSSPQPQQPPPASPSPHLGANAQNQQKLGSLAAALRTVPLPTLPPSTINPSYSSPQEHNQLQQVTSFGGGGGVGYNAYNSGAGSSTGGEQNQSQVQQQQLSPQLMNMNPYGYQQYYYGMGNNGNANANTNTVTQQSVPPSFESGNFNFQIPQGYSAGAVNGAIAGSGGGAMIRNQNNVQYYYPPHHHYQQL